MPFCSLRNFPDCSRFKMLQTDLRCETGYSGSLVGVRGLSRDCSRGSTRVFTSIFENKFVLVRWGVSEHGIDKHPLYFECFLRALICHQLIPLTNPFDDSARREDPFCTIVIEIDLKSFQKSLYLVTKFQSWPCYTNNSWVSSATPGFMGPRLMCMYGVDQLTR